MLQNRGCGIGESLLFFSFWATSAQPSKPAASKPVSYSQPAASHGALMNSISWCCACHARSRIVVVVFFFFSLFYLRACVRACRSHNRRGRTTRLWNIKKIHIGGPADALCLVPACRKGRAVEGTACAIMHDTYCCCCCAWLS